MRNTLSKNHILNGYEEQKKASQESCFAKRCNRCQQRFDCPY